MTQTQAEEFALTLRDEASAQMAHFVNMPNIKGKLVPKSAVDTLLNRLDKQIDDVSATLGEINNRYNNAMRVLDSLRSQIGGIYDN